MKKEMLASVLVVGCVAPVALAVGGGVVGLGILAGEDSGSDALCADSSLSVTVQGQVSGVGNYSPQAVENAAIILKVGEAEGISARGQLVGLMTAMQESRLGDDVTSFSPDENGDAGVFQQRQLPGRYGTLEEVTDTAYAAKVFYKGKTLSQEVPGGAVPKGYHIPGLVNVEGWESLPPTVAAQRVQRSAHPRRMQSTRPRHGRSSPPSPTWTRRSTRLSPVPRCAVERAAAAQRPPRETSPRSWSGRSQRSAKRTCLGEGDGTARRTAGRTARG